MSEEKMNLARYMAHCGIASRRKCSTLIEQGLVLVNGQPCEQISMKIDVQKDKVEYAGKTLSLDSYEYYLLHKPSGYVCSSEDQYAEKLAVDLIKTKARLFSVGRLDRESEGLIFFTNDGDWANRISHPRYEVRKTYLLTIKGQLGQANLDKMKSGIRDEDELLKVDSAKIVRQTKTQCVVEVILSEGKNRELRRICRALKLPLKRLLRIRIGDIELGKLETGIYRKLSKQERDSFLK
ncbi:MAG: rRNA pseudouridine synthase [Lentisphaeria bacterium]|nr:rRNA pseudouridine synthase [Lentisphaeria bacterium]NQZ67725.1 rRNA pseudouridine synthase [Lentisphaeria bacterium]